MTRALALVALLLALSGCGDGEDGQSDEEKAVAALTSSISDNSQGVKRADAECLAQGLVDELGIETLQDYGMLTDTLTVDKNVSAIELSEEDADMAATVYNDCIDVRAGLFDAIGAISEEAMACAENVLTDEVLQAYMANTLMGREPLTQKQSQALAACLQPE